MAVLDMALDREILKRKGSWIAYKGETLGQGKDAVASYIEEHPELMDEITKEVLDKVAAGLASPTNRRSMKSAKKARLKVQRRGAFLKKESSNSTSPSRKKKSNSARRVKPAQN